MKLVIDLQGSQTESRHRGIGRQARVLAEAMIERAGAHEVLIFLNGALPQEELRAQFGAILPPGHIRSFDIPTDVFEREPGNLWRMRAAELIREAALAELRPDVVHLTSLFEGINDNAVTSVGLLGRPFRTAVTLFDLIPLYDPPRYLGSPVAQRFYYRRALSLKRADLLLAISESARDEAVEMLSVPPERIAVAPLAADASFRPVSLSRSEEWLLRARYGLPERFVLYVGAIEARKNVALIIEAFGKLPRALQDSHALVFGGRIHPPERMELRAVACRFGVDPGKLVLPGYIAEEDLAPLYGLCSLFVFPSIHEGFGLPPLEAMACGAPVLAARNSALPEVMGRDDLLFGTFDAADLAGRMERILTEPAYADALRLWGPERAAQFSWAETGRKAVEALERLHDEGRRPAPARGTRLRLAFFSPLPSDRSGIADYSVELLRELGRFYDIECVIHETVVTDPWVLANFPLRDLGFFERHAHSYDRIVYNLGNSSFHEHMLALMERHPGVVVLHDFFLSGLLDWLGNVGRRSPDDFLRELYLTHGLPALRFALEEGRGAAARRFAANRLAFEDSLGVIVHSRWSVEAAQALFGPAAAAKVVQLPLMRAVGPRRSREEARRRLGLAPSDFVVCSFGFVCDTKLSDRLFDAWADTRAGRSAGATLVFVGENIGGAWGARLDEAIAERAGTVRAAITGFVDAARYDDYLAAADLAVQLRTESRGETSRAILDCMAAGLPVVVNAHGTSAELPDGAVCKLPDDIAPGDLARAIDGFFADPQGRARLGESGRDHLRTHHHPSRVGEAVRDAVERFSASGSGAIQASVVRAMQEMYAPALPSEEDFTAAAEAMARNGARIGLPRLLFDVTLLSEGDRHTGIERVVRSMLAQLLRSPPAGFRLEPVRIEGAGLRFARRFAAVKLGLPADVLPDSPVDPQAGDVYLTLEWAADRLPELRDWLLRFRRGGGRVVIGINDILPLLMPHRFPPFIGPVAQRWFETVLGVADQILCISRTVADDVIRFGDALSETRASPLPVDWYHCAHDIGASVPTRGLPADAPRLLDAMGRRRTFLMVGTLEPRKGHEQVLLAFAQLWRRRVDVGLVIVGRRGWMVDATERLIVDDPEYGERLVWLPDASDEYLDRLYGASTALIAASEAEGFGLPVVEAASHGLPVLARDIPVFREVAGPHASYFASDTPEGLAGEIEAWLALARKGKAPRSGDMPILTWTESAAQLLAALFGHSHYGAITGAPPRPPGGTPQMSDAVASGV